MVDGCAQTDLRLLFQLKFSQHSHPIPIGIIAILSLPPPTVRMSVYWMYNICPCVVVFAVDVLNNIVKTA